MPVNSTHPDYDSSLAGWRRARDVVAGEDAVKAAGEKYLPRLDSQSSNEYLGYKSRGSFFNAAARTTEGFVGLIFRRDPVVRVPSNKDTLTDIIAVNLDHYRLSADYRHGLHFCAADGLGLWLRQGCRTAHRFFDGLGVGDGRRCRGFLGVHWSRAHHFRARDGS